MKMKVLLLLSIFIILESVNCQEELYPTSQVSCNEIKDKSAMFRLKQYLFCEYDQDVRPIEKNKSVTNVVFSLLPQSFEIDDTTNVITLHTWMTLLWRDHHLAWEPSSYDNIRWFPVKSYEVWQPDIILHNAGDANIGSTMPSTNCWLSYQGDVYCVPTIVQRTTCIADHTWWPYDAVNCTFQFGSWSYSTEEIYVSFTTRAYEEELLNFGYEKSLMWKIERFYVTERTSRSKLDGKFNTKMGSYHFILKRHASIHTAVFVVPGLVLAILTLTTLWLEPDSIERTTVANINFVCHLLCINDVHWKIVGSSIQSPNLLLFYGNSFMLAAFSLIFTSILREMRIIKRQPPFWISSSATFILRSKLGRILLFATVLDPKLLAKIEAEAEDNTNLVSSERRESSWEFVVILLGWIAFLIVAVAYILMFATLIPTTASAKTYAINT